MFLLSIELFVRRVSAHVCSTGNLTMLVASGMKPVSSMLFDLESVEPEEVEHTVPCWPAVQEVQRLVLEASESVCQVCVGLYSLCLLHGSVLRSSTACSVLGRDPVVACLDLNNTPGILWVS